MSPRDFATDRNAQRIIDCFNGEDFLMWSTKLKMLLADKDLWDIVAGQEVQPDGSKPKELLDFKKRESNAMPTIWLNLENAQLSLVMEAQTPKEAWDILKSLYQTNRTANHLYLLRQLYGFPKKQGSDSMTIHINKLKAFTMKMAAIGTTIENIDFVSILFNSLLSEYSVLITNLENLEEAILTQSYVAAKLLHEERKLEKTGTHAKKEGAFYSIHPEKPKERKTEFMCHYCQKPGHYAKDCHKKKRDLRNKYGQANSAKTERDFLFVMALTATPDDSWIIDSGASMHMTSHREWFNTYKKIDPLKVYLGDNNTVEAVGIGNINLTTEVNGQTL